MTNVIKKVKYKEWNCLLKRGYYEGGRVALFLEDADDGEPITNCSVNLPGERLTEDEICIKDYSENEGMLDFLIKEGIVEPPSHYVQSGYVQIPVCRLKPLGDEDEFEQ